MSLKSCISYPYNSSRDKSTVKLRESNFKFIKVSFSSLKIRRFNKFDRKHKNGCLNKKINRFQHMINGGISEN